MRAFSWLVALAAASCMPADIDPKGKCKVKDGWGVFNADDEDAAGLISLAIETKDKHVDAYRDEHGKTVSKLSPKTNGRYILACKQKKDEKTVKFVVTRPADATAFGSEWVQLFPKDSWKNVTNEYEPFTFNKFGAKIPLLRDSHDDDGDDGPSATAEGTLVVYMEVSDIGDYEVMYGNPAYVTKYTDPETKKEEERWVAVRFSKTLLRVGSPWAECEEGGEALPAEKKDIGAIMPAFFGHPNLNLEAYKALAKSLEGTKVPVKVVLEIFNKATKLYTMSEKDEKNKVFKNKDKKPYDSCYEAGNACPENHNVCKDSYCEMDTWEQIIDLFQKIDKVEVLGAVGLETTSAQYNILDKKVNGFYFMKEGTIEAGDDGKLLENSVYSIGEPLLKSKDIEAVETYVTLTSDNLGIWNPYSWYPDKDNSKWAAILHSISSDDMKATLETLFDRGYGYVFLTDKENFKSASSYVTALHEDIATRAGATRRLQDRQLTASTPKYSWGCDDTGFHCSPVCLAQDGPVTTITSDEKCADAPLDACKCKCYYDSAWTCNNGEVVCQATKGIETMIVGDLLCESRGSPKPTFEELSGQRQAGECERVPTTRGEFPIEQCLVQWATTTTEAPEPTTTAAPVVAEKEEEPVVPQEIDIQVRASFAAVASMLVALTQ